MLEKTEYQKWTIQSN